MMLRNKRAVVRPPANPVLNINDRKKFYAFVALLVQIDKHNNPSTRELRRTRTNVKETKARDPTKAKDALLGQYRRGSQSRGPIFLKQLLYSYKHFFNFQY